MTSTPPATAERTRTPWRIFAPFLGVAIILGVYSVYWYVAAGKLQTGIETFAASSHSGEVAVGWSALSFSGYPYRIAATFTAPTITAPQAPEDWSWQAESLEADFLPYNLRHVVLTVDGEQMLRYRDVSGSQPRHHVVRAKAEGTWASYVDVKNAPFGRLAIDIEKFTAVRDEGEGGGKVGKPDAAERFAAERLQLHLRPSEDPATGAAAPVLVADAGSYDLALQGDDMVIGRTRATPILGPKIDFITVQARLRNMPENAKASIVELSRDWLQQGGTLAVSDLIVKWGPLNMWAQGEVTLDDKARPKGTFDAEISDYAGLLKALVKGGIVSERDAKVALLGMGLVAQMQGSEGKLRVPIVMNDGKLYLGPIVVATLEPVY